MFYKIVLLIKYNLRYPFDMKLDVILYSTKLTLSKETTNSKSHYSYTVY